VEENVADAAEALTGLPASRRVRARLRLWGLLLGAFCAILVIHPVRATDVFWRLSEGRAVLEHRARVIPEFAAFGAFSDPVVVPQWLWDLTTYSIYLAGSWPALAALTALLAFLVAVAVVKLVTESAERMPASVVIFVSSLTMTIAMSRMRLRPQAAALLLIPCFLLLLYRYRESDNPRRWLMGVALVAFEILWAQLHGSFVLVPALFAILVGLDTLVDRRGFWRQDGLVFASLIGGWFTSAHGLDVAAYISAHSSGYAAQHIAEMSAPTWSVFDPTVNLYGPIYAGMCLLTAAGMLRARRVWWIELGLALFGFALGLAALRFFVIGAVLMTPLCARATAAALTPAGGETPSRSVRGAMLACAVLFLGLVAHDKQATDGPLGSVGPSENLHPEMAARYIAAKGKGWNVLSDYDLSGQLGFWLDGAARTYIDSRTPAYFDDSDFGLAMEIWLFPGALARGIARYDIRAVVTERDSSVCRNLGDNWVPVSIEPSATTFVRRGQDTGLRKLAPCGPRFLAPDACEKNGRLLKEDIERLERLGATPFLSFLRTAHAVHCGDGPPSDEVAEWIPSADEARPYSAARNRLLAHYHRRRHEDSRAIDAVEVDIAAGNLHAYDAIAPILATSPEISIERKHALLESLVKRLDIKTPPTVRAELARTCIALGDVDCARFHGLRAAARGEDLGKDVLSWLTLAHPSERVRRDAEHWRRVLQATP
jgi:hypothetical protein